MEKKQNQSSEEIQTVIPEILDVLDLAELLRTKPQAVREFIKAKRIPGFKLAKGKYLVTKELLKKHIEDNNWNFN